MLMNWAKTMRTFDSFIEVVPKIKKTSEFLLCMKYHMKYLLEDSHLSEIHTDLAISLC